MIDLIGPVALPFTIMIDGEPAPKGSVERNRKRGVRHTRRSRDWHDVAVDALKLRIANLDGPVGLLERPIAVHAEFRLRRPVGTAADAPIAKRHGDIDKHLRSLLDALTGIVVADDALVTEVHATKRWAAPTERCGVQVHVDEPFPVIMARYAASVAAPIIELKFDELGFTPMAEPRGLLNISGVEVMPKDVLLDFISATQEPPPSSAAIRDSIVRAAQSIEPTYIPPSLRYTADPARMELECSAANPCPQHREFSGSNELGGHDGGG